MSEQGPLAGISVVELASWMMTPASGSILASFGADVIKIEPAGSADPIRRLNEVGVGGGTLEPSFELANNGKRSIQLDVRSEAGREVMQRLLEHADIFLTNVRAKALERAGLGLEALHQRYPRLIVAHGSSYGRVGPVAHHPSFDELAYWSRGGMATALQDEGTLPVAINGAMGDLPTAVTLAAGMLLALYRREREGVGSDRRCLAVPVRDLGERDGPRRGAGGRAVPPEAGPAPPVQSPGHLVPVRRRRLGSVRDAAADSLLAAALRGAGASGPGRRPPLRHHGAPL